MLVQHGEKLQAVFPVSSDGSSKDKSSAVIEFDAYGKSVGMGEENVKIRPQSYWG